MRPHPRSGLDDSEGYTLYIGPGGLRMPTEPDVSLLRDADPLLLRSPPLGLREEASGMIDAAAPASQCLLGPALVLAHLGVLAALPRLAAVDTQSILGEESSEVLTRLRAPCATLVLGRPGPVVLAPVLATELSVAEYAHELAGCAAEAEDGRRVEVRHDVQ